MPLETKPQTIPNEGQWQYKAVFTNLSTSALSITITIDIGKGARALFQYGSIGPDDYAAARSILFRLLDIEGNLVMNILTESNDNLVVNLPYLGENASNANAALHGNSLVFVGEDELTVQALSLAQDETISINFRMLVDTQPPIVSVSGGADVSTTTTYNRIR